MHVNWRLIWEVLQRKWLLCVLAYCNMPSNRLILKWCSLPLLFVFSHSMHVNSRLIWEVLQLKWLRCILTYCNMPSNRLILKWCSLPFLSPFFFLNKWMTYSIHLCTQTKNAHQKKKKKTCAEVAHMFRKKLKKKKHARETVFLRCKFCATRYNNSTRSIPCPFHEPFPKEMQHEIQHC